MNEDFARQPFARQSSCFVASLMTTVASVSSNLFFLPPQEINETSLMEPSFVIVKSRVSQQLIFSLEVEIRTGRPLVPRKK